MLDGLDLMKGKVVLVTGGSQGIGLAAAAAFARRGCRVVIASRERSRGLAAELALRQAGGEVAWQQADVTLPESVQALVAAVLERYGRLDCAFNNGGSGAAGGKLAEMELEQWDQTINGYLKSVFLSMRYELPVMLAQGSGVIVNNASVDGERGFPGDPLYSAAKHGVLGLTKSAALQVARKGVRINAVSPGWILTPLVQEILDEDPRNEERILRHQPVGRMGRPEEVAEAVVWLCSPAASLVTGTSLAVDGGYLAY